MDKKKTAPTNRVAELRKKAGLTQQQLADLVGRHWITVSKLERDQIRLTEEWADRLAPHLNVKAHELLPPVRRLGTVQVTGEIMPGGYVEEYEEDDPHTITLHSGYLHNINCKWFYVNSDALAPLFKDGDELCFLWRDGDPLDCIGRLCMNWYDDGEFKIGFLRQYRETDRFTILPVAEPPISNVKITHAFPLVMAIFSNDDLDE